MEFSVNQKARGEYINLANTYLHIRVHISDAAGKALPDDAHVGPINNFFHSLFSQVDISLNITLVTPSENIYPFKAYIEKTLNYDRC